MKTTVIFMLLLICCRASAQPKSDDIAGIWLTNGKEPAKIEIYKTDGKYSGRIVWMKNPNEAGQPRTDKNNPDKSKQSQPIVGLIILRNFIFDGKNEWEDGTIYDPENGKTYSSTISLKDKETLKVRGYIGVSLLGRTEIWNRSSL